MLKSRKKPNFVDRVRAAYQIVTQGYIRSGTPIGAGAGKKMPFAWPVPVNGVHQWTMFDFMPFVKEGYEINSVIHSAIMYKVKSLSLAPLRAYTGDVDRPKLLPTTNRLSMLLKRPNAFQTMRQLQGQAITHLNLAGNAYIFLDRPSRTAPVQRMFTLRPDRVRVLPAMGGVSGYLYIPEGKSQEDGYKIPPEYIAHVKFPNPADPYEGFGEGLSPMFPVARPGDVHNNVTRFLDLLFKNGTLSFGTLTFDLPLDDLTIERIRTQWDEKYAGYENWARPLVLDQGGKYQMGIPSFDELGFDSIDERNEALMLAPFGVPAVLIGVRIGLENATYSNVKELDKMFWQLTMAYELGLFEDALGAALNDGSDFVLYDTSKVPALQKDLKEIIAATKDLTSIGVPLNIAAEKTGLELEHIDGGDVGYLPMNLVPAMGKIPAGVPTALTPPPEPDPNNPDDPNNPPDDPGSGNGDTGRDNDQPAPGKGKFNRSRIIQRITGKQIPRATYKGITWDETKAFKVWQAQDLIARSWETRYRQAAMDAFNQNRVEILAMVSAEKQRAKARKATVIWETVKLSALEYLKANSIETWRQMFLPVMSGLVEDAGNAWATELGMTFDVHNVLALKWFDEYTLRFAQEINDTTKTGIADMLQQAQLDGWSVEQGTKRLESMFKQWMEGNLTPEDFAWFASRMPAYRLEMIVRTETIRSYGAGTVAMFKEWGIEKKQWWAAHDERTCPFCLDAHGKIITTGKDFYKLGDTLEVTDANGKIQKMDLKFENVGYPPLHPDCRCTVLPVD